MPGWWRNQPLAVPMILPSAESNAKGDTMLFGIDYARSVMQKLQEKEHQAYQEGYRDAKENAEQYRAGYDAGFNAGFDAGYALASLKSVRGQSQRGIQQ